MKKITIIIMVIILAIVAYLLIPNYHNFDPETQNDIKMAGFGLLLGISFIIINNLNIKNPRKNREIIRSILIFDLYILGNFFLKPNLNLNGTEFAIFFILLLLLILTSYIRHRIKAIIGLILGIGLIFFLLKSVFPDFEIDPNETNLQQIKDRLIIQTSEPTENLIYNNTKLTIEKSRNTKTLPIEGNIESPIDISDIKKISFLSKSDKIQAKIYISIGKDIIYLNPQSSVEFQTSGENMVIKSDSNKGKVGIYPNYPSKVIILGSNIASNTNPDSQEIQKMQDKKLFLISQYGGFLIENPFTRRISKTLLDISYYFFPEKYKNNIENYDTVMNLLEIEETENDYKNSQIGSGSKKNFFNQIKKGYGKTYLKLF